MRPIYRIYTVVILLLIPSVSQGDSVGWKRSAVKPQSDLFLFHSTHAVNLPTAETLNKGMLEIEISHRFQPPVSEGIEALYGFDGPVNMRIAVGYSLTNRAILTLGRSNVSDNVDFNIKYKLAQFHSNKFPILLAVQGGTGWNSAKSDNRSRGDARNFQYYGQLIANGLIARKLGIGVVPSYLYNSDIFSPKYEDVFAIGSYVQYYSSSLLSFLAEWNIGVSGDYKPDNAVSFGIELETGGHFFKIILTNSVLLNSSQFLPGTEYPFKSKEWRLGFLITRLMKT